jgi:hypothetical protein
MRFFVDCKSARKSRASARGISAPNAALPDAHRMLSFELAEEEANTPMRL